MGIWVSSILVRSPSLPNAIAFRWWNFDHFHAVNAFWSPPHTNPFAPMASRPAAPRRHNGTNKLHFQFLELFWFRFRPRNWSRKTDPKTNPESQVSCLISIGFLRARPRKRSRKTIPIREPVLVPKLHENATRGREKGVHVASFARTSSKSCFGPFRNKTDLQSTRRRYFLTHDFRALTSLSL